MCVRAACVGGGDDEGMGERRPRCNNNRRWARAPQNRSFESARRWISDVEKHSGHLSASEQPVRMLLGNKVDLGGWSSR